MSAGMPELGSKISLISKADIRYEGRLYTVDPQECTIALSSVRSFGTEDRETQFQIAPQSQIYDYILFRGSDIKDIRVVNNSLPHPNDPAIMQVQLQNGQHVMPQFSMHGMNQPHAPPPMSAGAYGHPFGGIGGLGNLGGNASGTTGSLAPGAGAPGPFMLGNQQQQSQAQQQQQSQQQQQQQQQQEQAFTTESRVATPVSPTGESQQQQQVQKHHQNQNAIGHGGNVRDAGHKRQSHQQRPVGIGGGGSVGGGGNGGNSFPYNQQRYRRNYDYMQNNYNNNQRNNHPGGQNRNWNMHRGGPQNQNNNMMNKNRGGGGRGRMQNQGYRPPGGGPGSGSGMAIQNRPLNKLKFEQDFDFEQANNKFEELRSQLSKLKVGDDPKSTEQINGETDKKDDSGNETGAGEHEPEDEEIHVGYDKTKSFFDNISCETAQDRNKNKKNDWRQERKLNSETFGASSTRYVNRTNYRGRGGNYFNRNAGNYAGGGGGGGGNYNRGHRGGNNYRNRSNNRTGGGSGNRDHSDTNANNNNTGIPNGASTLKQQTQQPQATAAINANTAAATTKATSLKENSTPQVAAVSAGQ